MANLFVTLPADGTPMDVSALGRLKTLTLENGMGFLGNIVPVEFSNGGAGGPWALLHSFQQTGKERFNVAAQFMRARGAAVEVASNDEGALFANLPAPAANGVGAPVDVSALGTFNTVTCLGAFGGVVTVEISEDGTDWSQCLFFAAPGSQSKSFTARFMRVRRTGTPMFPGLPVVDVGAINDSISMTSDKVYEASLFRDTAPSTSGGVFVDGMGGGVLTVPETANYFSSYEGVGLISDLGGELEIAIRVDGAEVANSERLFSGVPVPLGGQFATVTSIALGALTAGQEVSMSFRKSGGPGSVGLGDRNLSLWKVV